MRIFRFIEKSKRKIKQKIEKKNMREIQHQSKERGK